MLRRLKNGWETKEEAVNLLFHKNPENKIILIFYLGDCVIVAEAASIKQMNSHAAKNIFY